MSSVLREIDRLVEERSLLKHSFYTRWVEGTLPRRALCEYARQYYRFEAAFPRVLSRVHTQLEDLADRQLVLENLWDEEHGPDCHVELWLRFAQAVGVPREEVLAAPPRPATAALVDTYLGLAGASPAAGLAALYAYERQVPAVAAAKLQGLARHFGLAAGPGLAFWEVHGALDAAHAQAEAELLARHAGPEAVGAAASALDAWWGFLTEVEAAA